MSVNLNKYVERIERDIPSDFLELNEQKIVKGMLVKKKIPFCEYRLTKEDEKVIFYQKTKPEVIIYLVKANKNITHKEVLGTLYSHGLEPSVYGDILIKENIAYIPVIDRITSYIESHLKEIGRSKIVLEKADRKDIENYEKQFIELSIIVSSLRLDNVLSKICSTNRKSVQEKIDHHFIRVNNEVITKPTYLVKEGDIISVRRVGKFKYMNTKHETKKNNLVLIIHQYN